MITNRRRLPKERNAKTSHVAIHGADGPFDFFLIVGEFEDGELGEIFIKLGAHGETKSDLLQGLLDAWAITFSIALQHGADLSLLLEKLAHAQFQPAGITNDPNIKRATSIVDYVALWLARAYGEPGLYARLREAAVS
jgi:ribonucleoside-diphosphate reductase alpha chain